jgi:hypothetical protein
MGWCGGTEIFDQVADDLISASYDHFGSMKHQFVITPLENLYEVLSDLDWDCECESDYYDHPEIGKILGNTFEVE